MKKEKKLNQIMVSKFLISLLLLSLLSCQNRFSNRVSNNIEVEKVYTLDERDFEVFNFEIRHKSINKMNEFTFCIYVSDPNRRILVYKGGLEHLSISNIQIPISFQENNKYYIYVSAIDEKKKLEYYWGADVPYTLDSTKKNIIELLYSDDSEESITLVIK